LEEERKAAVHEIRIVQIDGGGFSRLLGERGRNRCASAL
jgi:hypothetical protein